MHLSYTRDASQCYQYGQRVLSRTFTDPQERHTVIMRLIHYVTRCRMADVIAATPLALTDRQINELAAGWRRLQKGEPIQYIIGEAPFLHHTFYINASALIPRPETAMMAHQIISHYAQRPPASVLDLCTGSGCLAISLAKAFPKTQVTGLDNSPAALTVAHRNAQRFGVRIRWRGQDILESPLPEKKWALIVSNPPYVLPEEKKTMAKRVLDYEPHEALFVPENNPFVFYTRIAALAAQHLKAKGRLYMEMNARHGEIVKAICEQAGLVEVKIHQDDYGKDRWISAEQVD